MLLQKSQKIAKHNFIK